MLGAKHGFTQFADYTVQSKDLDPCFGRAILGFPNACTIPELCMRHCGGHNYHYKAPVFEAKV